MNEISLFDGLGSLFFVFALILIGTAKYRRIFSSKSVIVLFIYSLFSFLHNFSNFVEWSGLTSLLDPVEDYVEVLLPLIWGNVFFILFQEITEANLRANHEKFRSLVTNTPDVKWTKDERGRVDYISPNVIDILGFSPDEIYRENGGIWFSRIHPRDAARIQEYHLKLCRFKEPFDRRYRVRHKDGHWIWIHDRSFTTYHRQGEVYADGVFADVTKHVKMDQELKTASAKYQRIFEMQRDAVCIINLGSLTIREANPVANSMFKIDFPDMTGKHIREIFPPKITQLVDYYKNHIRSGKDFHEELSDILVGGSSLDFVIEGVPFVALKDENEQDELTSASLSEENDERDIDLLLILKDVTRQNAMVKDANHAKNFIELVLNNIPQRIFWKDRNSVYLGCNENFARDADLKNSKEIIGKTDYDLCWPKEEADSYREYDRRVMENSTPYLKIIEPQMRADGVSSWLETNKIPLQNENGEVIGLLGTYQDITETVNQERALKESEYRFRELSSAASEAILIHDNGVMLEANDRFFEMFGYTMNESLGRMILDKLTAPKELEKVRSIVREGGIADYTSYGLKKDGTVFPIKIYSKDTTYHGKKVRVAIIRDISESVKSESELKASEAKFKAILEGSSDGIAAVDPKTGKFIFVNQGLSELTGYTLADFTELKCHDVMSDTIEFDVCCLETTKKVLEDIPIRRKDGNMVYCDVSGHEIVLDDKVYIVRFFRDVTVRRQSEEKLRKLSLAVEQSPACVMITDINGDIEYVNPRFVELTGYSTTEVIGKNPRFLKSGHLSEDKYRELWQMITSGQEWRGEFFNKKKNGEFYWEAASISPIRDPRTGNITHFIGIKEDITMHKQYEEQLFHKANYDELTSLPNRFLALDRIAQAVGRAHREQSKVAVMFLDLDQFKIVNDTLGHSAGDDLLVEASARLKGAVRTSDTVARLGGDEFLVILADLRNHNDAAAIAQKILDSFASPFYLAGREIFVTTSIGITIYPNDGNSSQILLKNADAAMYKAKEESRNAFRFFTQEMNIAAMNRINLEGRLRHALERQEIFLVYQPMIDINTRRIVGAESLLRWHDNEGGLILPENFIPLAEDTGIIIPLGEWVLNSACQQIKKWREQFNLDLRIAVNVSPRQFKNANFVKQLSYILREIHLPPSCVELEITERFLIEDAPLSHTTFQELSQMGICLSLDDFGTGYSALSYLKKFSFDTLKIDRIFVRDVTVDPEDAALSTAIISMAHSLGLKVIGEGVESAEQFDFLKIKGCDQAQGFYLSKPMNVEDFTAFLSEHPDGIV